MALARRKLVEQGIAPLAHLHTSSTHTPESS
jgi:hypothetical protein